MRVIALLFVSLLTYVCADPQLQVAAVAGVQPGQYRQFTVVANPGFSDATGWAMQGVGFGANSTSNGASVELDVATLSFVNPENDPNNQVLGFYFGYFTAGASWTKTVGIAHGSAVAALAEVAAVFDSLFVYFNYDGQPGFQYTLGNSIWDCTAAQAASPKYDCFNSAYSIALKSLDWSDLVYANVSCPTGSGYAANCAVHTFTTSGSQNGTVVIEFVFKLANQPVLVDGVQITSDYGKIDININYPWTAMGVTETNAKVGLFSYGIGKAAAGAATYTKVQGQNGLVFAGAAGAVKTAFFSWAGTATVANGAGTVYFQGITGSQVTSHCGGTSYTCGVIEAVVFAAYTVVIDIYGALGWNVELLWFSWDETLPASVAWDPFIGVNGGSTSAAGVVAPTLAFVVGSILLSFLNLMNQ